ncbi:MAG: arylsulfatase A-like enzyme [Paracoccaceae bacterium]|jgi:arylsulfatase A-like enzyme
MKQKNVLFIVVDQFRADLLFGGLADVVNLPNIRALMDDSVSFRNHWTVTVPCGPARASLLTGQYAMNHRSVRNGTPLDHTITTIPREMRKAGYAPMLFGYSDTPGDPRVYDANDPALRTYERPMREFDEKVEMRLDESFPWRGYLAARGYDLPPYAKFYEPNGPDLDSPAFYAKEDSDTAFLTDECLKILNVMQERRWFAHLTYIRPHPPFVAPEPYNRLYQGANIPPTLPLDADIRAHPFIRDAVQRYTMAKTVKGQPDLPDTPETAETIRQIYLGLATEVDHHIGRMIQFLKDSDQYDTTQIILCADHGEMLGDHDSWGKVTVFDAAHRIPLIIRDPDIGTPGRVVDVPTESIDIFPTLLDYAGLEHPTSLDGRSLYPLMQGDVPEDWRDYTYSELDFPQLDDPQGGDPVAEMKLENRNAAILREADLTLVYFNGGLPPLLFDHRAKGEAQNLADDPAYASDLLRLTRKMLDHRMTHANSTLSSFDITADGPVRAK